MLGPDYGELGRVIYGKYAINVIEKSACSRESLLGKYAPSAWLPLPPGEGWGEERRYVPRLAGLAGTLALPYGPHVVVPHAVRRDRAEISPRGISRCARIDRCATSALPLRMRWTTGSLSKLAELAVRGVPWPKTPNTARSDT